MTLTTRKKVRKSKNRTQKITMSVEFEQTTNVIKTEMSALEAVNINLSNKSNEWFKY